MKRADRRAYLSIVFGESDSKVHSSCCFDLHPIGGANEIRGTAHLCLVRRSKSIGRPVLGARQHLDQVIEADGIPREKFAL